MISPMVNVTEIEGRGRSIVSTQALKGGDIILKDSPILLYSSFPLSPPQAAEQNYCSHCFRSILSLSISPSCPCPECSISYFCSSNCWATARNSSRTPWVCQSLIHLREVFSDSPIDKDLHVQSRYLIAAYNLASIDPSNFQILLSLQGDHTSVNGEEARYFEFFQVCKRIDTKPSEEFPIIEKPPSSFLQAMKEFVREEARISNARMDLLVPLGGANLQASTTPNLENESTSWELALDESATNTSKLAGGLDSLFEDCSTSYNPFYLSNEQEQKIMMTPQQKAQDTNPFHDSYTPVQAYNPFTGLM